MPVAKNHVPLTEIRMVRFTKKDVQLLKKVAKEKRLNIAALIRMAVFYYLEKEGKTK